MKTNQVFYLGLASILTVGFQNCSPKHFSATASSETVEKVETTRESYTASTQTPIKKADILFIVDESVSMQSIASHLVQGMKLISAVSFPQDTLMGVINMAPAKYIDENNFDLTQAYYGATTASQPGFVRFVNGTSITSFLNRYPEYSSKFPLKGCTSWFTPQAVNADGESCLSAHAQIALTGTGVEAGTVTLKQVLERVSSNGRRTFRKGSYVNIIFVSDTHDAGVKNYYGTTGAPAQIVSYESLRSKIEATNPELAGVKFHGIVPLPPAGDSNLAGVKTIGTLPATLAESKIGAEELNGFSYLPFIAKSGGSALHPKGGSWASALDQMIDEVSVKRTTIIETAKPISSVVKVVVDGVELATSQYTVIASNKIEILLHSGWPANIAVEVEYVPVQI